MTIFTRHRKWTYLATFVAALALFGFARLPSAKSVSPDKAAVVVPPTKLNTTCASPIFSMGRKLNFSELTNYSAMKFSLEAIHFRDVLYRNSNDIELAYRSEIKMRLNEDRFLVPEQEIVCREKNVDSPRVRGLSRTMFPVIGDLYLPSTRITVYDQESADNDRLYNLPRISEVSVSSEGYFSFNQNWEPYKKLQTVGQYVEILRYRSLFSWVEIREMGYGRIGIYAEKDVGGEKAQLLIVMVQAD